ncbi:homocysteine S-methyltransferase family protein [Leptolyngbya cf. ectocarpi LEGE 11479]|uniref:Homocysteine S-methyltransferase family protein n=2 Tax=Leptolyngbya ectocarpi TaxID=1202 RepID=A0A929FD94_LEPEC|nr:homocysteine S-methyltransferase family protein [Leptolyngbya cf. ectocarpi LEGE 11479]
MGQELIRRSQGPATSLWSAQVLLDQPKLVQDLHEDYIRAGSKVITTNTYITVRHRLQRDAGLGDKFKELNQLAGELAVQARESTGVPVLIAGSLPPLFGSYRPDQVRSVKELEPLYQEQMEILEPYVDLFLCETLSKAEEGLAAVRAASKTNKPVWVSWTLEDIGSNRLRGGESLSDAWQILSDLPIETLLVNCCSPESITAAMPELSSFTDKVGGYANGFQQIPKQWSISDGISALGQRHDLDPDSYAVHVQRWIDAGATVVGGCCETTPAHIQKIADLLRSKNGS